MTAAVTAFADLDEIALIDIQICSAGGIARSEQSSWRSIAGLCVTRGIASKCCDATEEVFDEMSRAPG